MPPATSASGTLGPDFNKGYDDTVPSIKNLTLRTTTGGTLPVGSATDTPMITWDPVPGAVKYEFAASRQYSGLLRLGSSRSADFHVHPGLDAVGATTLVRSGGGGQWCFRRRAPIRPRTRAGADVLWRLDPAGQLQPSPRSTAAGPAGCQPRATSTGCRRATISFRRNLRAHDQDSGVHLEPRRRRLRLQGHRFAGHELHQHRRRRQSPGSRRLRPKTPSAATRRRTTTGTSCREMRAARTSTPPRITSATPRSSTRSTSPSNPPAPDRPGQWRRRDHAADVLVVRCRGRRRSIACRSRRIRPSATRSMM